jgi:hypothetical protein
MGRTLWREAGGECERSGAIPILARGQLLLWSVHRFQGRHCLKVHRLWWMNDTHEEGATTSLFALALTLVIEYKHYTILPYDLYKGLSDPFM